MVRLIFELIVHCIKLQNLCSKESYLLEYIDKRYPNTATFIRSLEDE